MLLHNFELEFDMRKGKTVTFELTMVMLFWHRTFEPFGLEDSFILTRRPDCIQGLQEVSTKSLKSL